MLYAQTAWHPENKIEKRDTNTKLNIWMHFLLLPVLPIRKSVLHCTINGPQQCFPHESNALILHTTGSKIIKYFMYGCCFTSLFQYTTITIKLLSHNEYLSTVWYDFHKKYKNKSCGLKHSSMYKSFSVYPLHLQYCIHVSLKLGDTCRNK